MTSKVFKLVGIVVVSFILTSSVVDLENLFNYSNQTKPSYITKDNTFGFNPITDEGATLGRVLFYDKRLSVNNTISCGSCHIQAFAFSDTAQQSIGLHGGLTERHSMRLVNTSFAQEYRFFWDERAVYIESQTTQPIQDHIEMGFSGTEGKPGLDSLIAKLSTIEDYKRLFEMTYGDDQITEQRLQLALAQFIKSIQSFDSKFDAGLAMVNNNVNANFPNFTAQENEGKNLFLQPPPNGGAGCQGCHRAPEFDIDPNSRNNGVIEVAGNPNAVDLTNTRSPSLRDLVNPNGVLNGPLMHNGVFNSLMEVIEHYNVIHANPQINNNLDFRLQGLPGSGNSGQNLNLSNDQKLALEHFLRTLTGSDIYTNPMYSDPFEADGTLQILPTTTTSGCMDACAENYNVDAIVDDGSCNYANVSIVNLPASTLATNPVNLSGNPAGGTFSGAGVAFNVFNPSIAGVGLHTITYTYTNNDNCTQTATENILVASISFNFVNYQLNLELPKLSTADNQAVPFQLFDLSGRLVEQGILKEYNNFNHLKKGMYLINFTIKGEQFNHKFISNKF